ncbi:MAG: hypothetical protein ABSH16_01040 [Sedimentisphaerales bacterium]
MVLVLYFVYNRVNRTPAITTNSAVPPGIQQPAESYDANTITGRVGNVGVGTAKNVRYTKLNPQKQVEREFGFEELLHQDGNDWEIEKPYYTIYGRQFKSTISGDKARVTVETSGGQVAPKEGMLSGNVTIRIWPTKKGTFSDAVIYLDDISFAGDRSLFSTEGMVEIDSNEVQMKGTGLEVVFNGDDQRLEHLKIAKLKNLWLKRWSKQTAPGSTPSTALGTGSLTTDGSDLPRQQADGNEHKQPGRTGKEYKCVLDRNVVIDTAQERLLADVVSISNFLMSGGSQEEQGRESTDQNNTERNINPAPAEMAGDVTITCDGGILLVPMDSAEELKTANGTENIEHGVLGVPAGDRVQKAEWKMEERRDGRMMLCSRQLNYNAATGEALATGPTQLIFDVNSRTQEPAALGKPAQGPETVTIISQKQARFQPALNRAAFEGDCKCTVMQKLPDSDRQYIVTAETIEAVLKNKGGDGSATPDIERLIAKGGDVRLASTRKANERLLSGVEMKCVRMDYNTVSKDFSATGPGLIKVDNSQTDEPQKGLGRFSLRRKCYAFVRNFDSLQFAGQSNHLTADAGDGSMLVDYFPLSDSNAAPAKNVSGKQDKVSITASHVEADISETPQGRMELNAFTAAGAVTYADKDVDVAGNEFAYDVNNGTINIRGDKLMPLRFNGAIFDTVQYDVKNNKWKTKIKGPGAIR